MGQSDRDGFDSDVGIKVTNIRGLICGLGRAVVSYM